MITTADIRKKMQEYAPAVMESNFQSAVLIPMVEYQGQTHILFELRSGALQHQPGEVCFPGGAIEPGESPEDCARRETIEELGVREKEIEIFGQFDILHNYTNITIYTFAGTLSQQALSMLSFGKDGIAGHIANPQEVAEIFLVPLSYFQTQEPYVYHYRVKPEIGTDFPYDKVVSEDKYNWRQGRYTVPIYQYGDFVIWGITARILCNFLEKMKIGRI